MQHKSWSYYSQPNKETLQKVDEVLSKQDLWSIFRPNNSELRPVSFLQPHFISWHGSDRYRQRWFEIRQVRVLSQGCFDVEIL